MGTGIQGRRHHRSWGGGHAPHTFFKCSFFYCIDPTPSNAFTPIPHRQIRGSALENEDIKTPFAILVIAISWLIGILRQPGLQMLCVNFSTTVDRWWLL